MVPSLEVFCLPAVIFLYPGWKPVLSVPPWFTYPEVVTALWSGITCLSGRRRRLLTFVGLLRVTPQSRLDLFATAPRLRASSQSSPTTNEKAALFFFSFQDSFLQRWTQQIVMNLCMAIKMSWGVTTN